MFQPGKSGNPAGRPLGSRNKLQEDFLKTLAADFAENGKAALEDMRAKDASGYIRAIASLMPKELQVTRPLDDLSDEQLDAAITAVRAILAAQGDGGQSGTTAETQPAGELQAIPQAS